MKNKKCNVQFDHTSMYLCTPFSEEWRTFQLDKSKLCIHHLSIIQN